MPSMVWIKDSSFSVRVCAVRVLEIVEGSVLKLCLYNLQNKCVCTEELVHYTSALFCIFAINFIFQCVVQRRNSFSKE
jgi:hypothetical protein